MRQFRYPSAIPPLETRPVDPQTGTWTYEWRAWFEAMQLQAGGQGQDAIYDATIAAQTLGEENRDRIEALERRQSEASIALTAGLSALGELSRLDKASARNLARATVGSRQIGTDTDHYLVPAGTYANGAAAQAAFDNLDIIASPNLRLDAGDAVDVDLDIYIEATADIFNHCYLTVEIQRLGGTGTSVLTSRSIYINHVDVSGNMTSAGYEVPERVSIRLQDTIPSAASDYRYRALLTNALVSGNTFENWNDNSGARELIVREARIEAVRLDPRLVSSE